MKHPYTRSSRRHNGEVWRNRQRFIMLNVWSIHSTNSFSLVDNNMWWGRKKTYGHGNRCMCHSEKRSRKDIRKRRQGLDARANRKSVQMQAL